MSRNKNTPVIVLTILFIMIALMAVAWSLGSFSIQANTNATSIVSLPEVKTSVLGDDGKAHSINAKISVEINRDAQKKIDNDELYTRIHTAITGLDYDMITSSEGMGYMKDEINKGINGIMPDASLVNVYITDILNDYQAPEEKESKKANKGLKAFFQI